jgi:hypothetical protein
MVSRAMKIDMPRPGKCYEEMRRDIPRILAREVKAVAHNSLRRYEN